MSGLGSSTLKALRDLQMGAHWGLSGRSGEYAAGNGAAMRAIVNNQLKEDISLIDLVTPFIPDTGVRDNLLKLQATSPFHIQEAAGIIGCGGHVIESVPLAIFAAQQMRWNGFQQVISDIIQCGGDTDTNASLAGQLMGAMTGYSGIPALLLNCFSMIKECGYIIEVADNLSSAMEKRE